MLHLCSTFGVWLTPILLTLDRYKKGRHFLGQMHANFEVIWSTLLPIMRIMPFSNHLYNKPGPHRTCDPHSQWHPMSQTNYHYLTFEVFKWTIILMCQKLNSLSTLSKEKLIISHKEQAACSDPWHIEPWSLSSPEWITQVNISLSSHTFCLSTFQLKVIGSTMKVENIFESFWNESDWLLILANIDVNLNCRWHFALQ